MENIHKATILGITGAFGSGKSTAASFFESNGFKKIILSSFLEEEAKKRSKEPITRKLLQDIANEWREAYGSGVLAKKAIEHVRNTRNNIVIDGIRNAGEIDELRKNGNFVLLSIVTDRRTRFERLKLSPRRESLTWKLFTQLDNRDLGVGEQATGLQTGLCIGLADVYIENNLSLQDFQSRLNIFLERVQK